MAHVDYITASLPYDIAIMAHLPDHEAFTAVTQVKPVPRYEKTWLMRNGALLSIPTEAMARQKILYQAGGEALQETRDLGIEDTKLLYWLVREKEARFPRLDVAFDTDHSDSCPESLYFEWENKRAVTHVRKDPRILLEGGASTIYFGSTENNRMLRCYDKAAELKLLGQVLTRVELQARNAMAQQLAWQIVENNEIDLTAAAHIKDFIDFPALAWFAALLKAGGVKVAKTGRKKTDWQKYIKNTIIPGIIQHYHDNDIDDRHFIRKTVKELSRHIEKLEKHYARTIFDVPTTNE